MSEIARVIVSIGVGVIFGFLAGLATGAYVFSRMIERLIKQYEEGR